jgi:hypothetical protein
MDIGWILDGYWMDIGWILDGYWMDIGWILDGYWRYRAIWHRVRFSGYFSNIGGNGVPNIKKEVLYKVR